MHSPSQGYNSSSDVYTSRGYGLHLMGHSNVNNYYLNRDDPYNAHHYPNGPSLQSTAQQPPPPQQQHYPTSAGGPSHTYPINHFGHQPHPPPPPPPQQQQDVYSCSPRQLSYPPLQSMNTPRLKSYWNCDTQQQQQPQSNCYTNSPHKSSPHHQAWSRSPNMISSPSTTPSPIPCPSTPHHFASSPHHHATDSTHKPYNNGLMGSPNVNGSGGGSCGNNPLQSLQKMVQIESESGTHYDGSSAVPIQQSGPQQQQQATTAAPTNAGHSMMDSDQSAYPTYYNLDQNRLCSTPQAAAAYSAIPTAQSMNSTPFSPTLKNSAEMQRSQLSNCVKQEIAENGELSRGSTAAAARYPKLTKETPVQNSSSASTTYLNNGSCSTDSNGSPTAQTNKIVSIPESVMQTDQTHDSINSFRGSETTANSRDSVKSTDSDAMSSYAVSQCSTPNNWKVNSGQVGGQQPSGEFRSNNFNNSQKSWWADNSGQPLSSQQMPDQCSQFASGVNYSPSQLSNQMQSNSSMSPSSQSWSQQPSMAAGSQIGLTGANFPADGVVVKKKRGRPFGSKNRRNLETPPNVPDTSKRRRKITLVDMAVNTNLSFNVQASLYQDDAMAFSSTLGLKLHPPQQPKQPPPQPLTRRKKQQFGGPVIRIDKTQPELHNSKYSIVNSFKSQEDDKDKVQKSINESYSQTRKYGLSKSKKSLLLNSNHANSNSCGTLNKNWICILCHKGPNYKGLGDLYGPYVISLDKSKLCFSQENDAPTNVVNENHHEDCDTTVEQPQQPERRSLRRRTDEKSNHVEDATKDITGKQDVDVWIHEDCIVWSNNVYLEGTKIRNLEPAIVESFESVCTKCKLPGATLGCIYKNCNVSPLHYLCAKEKDCDLDEEKFILSCSKHKKRRILPKDPEVEVSEATTTAPTTIPSSNTATAATTAT